MTITKLDEIIKELLKFGEPHTAVRQAILDAADALRQYRDMLMPREK